MSEAVQKNKSRAHFYMKLGLSAAIVFQLFCVSFAPNRNAYLRNRFSRFTDPYTNFMGLASTWSFFAPDPGPPPLYIEYEVLDKKGVSLRTGTWPSPDERLFFSDRMLRRGAAAQFMLSHPDYAMNMLVPYFCQNDGAIGAVRLWATIYSTPSIQEVAEGKRAIGDEVNLEKKSLGYDFCPDKSSS